MTIYKHFVTISSQLYFCSSPIRLDSYNRCQFGCVYCFSRNRAASTSGRGWRDANPSAFAERLKRISKGVVRSALDEFLQHRVPIQLGGLQDPFSPLERTRHVTLDLLKILKDFNYPTLISTKGDLFLEDRYWNLLAEMPVYIRLSAAAVPENKRALVDVGGDRFSQTCKKIAMIRSAGIPVSLRIQPVFPGFEAEALRMTNKAAAAGVMHVSFEYLKLGTEGRDQQCRTISRLLETDIWKSMSEMGMKRVGRDYTLLPSSKEKFLRKAKSTCNDAGIKFGAGDTEFIHLSDGNGCCNGSSLFLKNSMQFRANFVGVLSGTQVGSRIRFSDLSDVWHPSKSVHSYLTTDSRGRDKSGNYDSWLSLMAHRWNGGRSPYSPAFFFGIAWQGEIDVSGFKVYTVVDTF